MNGALLAAEAITRTSTGEAVVFWVLAPVALAAAFGMIMSKNTVHAALWLVLVMFCLAVFYVVQDAPFLGAVQIIVYAGAIMVLFLFVVMLLNLGHADVGDFRDKKVRFGAGAVALLMLAELLVLTRGRVPEVAPSDEPVANVVQPVAEVLFTEHLLAFELTSVLLLVAIIGAVVLAKRRVTT